MCVLSLMPNLLVNVSSTLAHDFSALVVSKLFCPWRNTAAWSDGEQPEKTLFLLDLYTRQRVFLDLHYQLFEFCSSIQEKTEPHIQTQVATWSWNIWQLPNSGQCYNPHLDLLFKLLHADQQSRHMLILLNPSMVVEKLNHHFFMKINIGSDWLLITGFTTRSLHN